jgi:hypothetical protein
MDEKRRRKEKKLKSIATIPGHNEIEINKILRLMDFTVD